MKLLMYLFIFWFMVMSFSDALAQNIKLTPSSKIYKSDSIAIKQQKFAPQKFNLGYNYYENLGVVCKAEFKLEKATKIPLRVRLGSLAQTDYLERKPNAQKPE